MAWVLFVRDTSKLMYSIMQKSLPRNGQTRVYKSERYNFSLLCISIVLHESSKIQQIGGFLAIKKAICDKWFKNLESHYVRVKQ